MVVARAKARSSARLVVLAAFAAIGLARAAQAQTPADLANRMRPATDPAQELQTLLNVQDAEFRRRFFSETPIAERMLIDYGGYFRYGFSAIDDSQSRTQYLNQYDGRFYGRIELDGWLRFFGRLRVEYDAWNTIGDFAPTEEGWQRPVGELYWLEFDLGNWMSSQDGSGREWSLKARGGRQFVYWANGLSLANYMYAGTLDASVDSLGATGLLGFTAGGDTIDWDTSRPGYDNDTDRMYLGAKFDVKLGAHTPFFYYLAQFDQNAGQRAILPEGVAPEFQVPVRFRYNSQYWGTGINGSFGSNWLYRLEFALETGSTLSDPIKHDPLIPPTDLGQPQQSATILAQAGLAGVSWVGQDAMDSRIDFQCLIGSGSVYRLDTGNTYGGILPGKTDTSFNSLGYVNTGLVFAPDASNCFIPSIGYSISPFKGVDIIGDARLSVNAFLYVRLNADAPISVPTNLGGSNLVGSEYDFNVDMRIFSDLNMSVRYGLFVPNTGLFTDVESEPRQFFYVGATYAF